MRATMESQAQTFEVFGNRRFVWGHGETRRRLDGGSVTGFAATMPH